MWQRVGESGGEREKERAIPAGTCGAANRVSNKRRRKGAQKYQEDKKKHYRVRGGKSGLRAMLRRRGRRDSYA